MMKPSEIFAIIIRTVGLLTCLNAALALLAGFLLLVPGRELGQAFFLILVGAALFGIGLWMLRGAPGIIDFAYPEEKRYPQDPQELMDWMTSDKNV